MSFVAHTSSISAPWMRARNGSAFTGVLISEPLSAVAEALTQLVLMQSIPDDAPEDLIDRCLDGHGIPARSYTNRLEIAQNAFDVWKQGGTLIGWERSTPDGRAYPPYTVTAIGLTALLAPLGKVPEPSVCVVLSTNRQIWSRPISAQRVYQDMVPNVAKFFRVVFVGSSLQNSWDETLCEDTTLCLDSTTCGFTGPLNTFDEIVSTTRTFTPAQHHCAGILFAASSGTISALSTELDATDPSYGFVKTTNGTAFRVPNTRA